MSADTAAFDAAISIGSNIGDKQGNIRQAISKLTDDGALRLVARSADYRTDPWGKTDQDWFVNACITVRTELSAHDVLLRCQSVEADLKRERKERWGPRVIDLDVIWYRGEQIILADMLVPHPRAAERAFVLVPLAEIAPDIKIDGQRIDWLANRSDRSGIEKI